MITQRAVLVGIVGFCLYLIALVNNLPSYFYVLTWLAVSILVSSGGIALLSLLGLECRWHVGQKSGAESPELDESSSANVPGASGPSLEIELANTGTLNKIDTLIDVRLQHQGRGTRTTQRFLIEALPSGTALSSTLILRGLPRGRYKILSLRITGSDVLGLFRARRMAPIVGEEPKVRPFWDVLLRRNREKSDRRTIEILVGPALLESGARGSEGHSVAAGEEAASSDLLGRSDEMRGTRPYVAGDDLRTVHWKSTARLGRLVVREFDRLARPQSVVLWDGAPAWGDEAALYEAFEGASPMESGLRLAASLCGALAAQNRPCTLLRLDSRPAIVAAERGLARMQAARCLEMLAGADAERETDLPTALAAWTKELENASEIFIVSAAPASELKDTILFLQRLGLRVVLCACDAARWPRVKRKRRRRALRGAKNSAPRTAHQEWRSANREPRASDSPAESFADVEALSGLGVRVVSFAPGDENFWRDSSPVLKRALAEALGASRVRRAPAQNTPAQNMLAQNTLAQNASPENVGAP